MIEAGWEPGHLGSPRAWGGEIQWLEQGGLGARCDKTGDFPVFACVLCASVSLCNSIGGLLLLGPRCDPACQLGPRPWPGDWGPSDWGPPQLGSSWFRPVAGQWAEGPGPAWPVLRGTRPETPKTCLGWVWTPHNPPVMLAESPCRPEPWEGPGGGQGEGTPWGGPRGQQGLALESANPREGPSH